VVHGSAYAKLIIAPTLWGSALVAGRIVTVDLDPYTITWVRFLLVSLFLLPILRMRQGELPRPTLREWLLIILLSLSGVVLYNYMLFSGLTLITAVRSSVIMALTPAIVAILNALLFHERSGWLSIVGIGLAFTGAFVTITDGDVAAVVGRGVSRGDTFLLGAALAWAVYTILARFAMGRLSALTVLTYSSVVGVVILLPVAIGLRIPAAILHLPLKPLLGLLYLSVAAAGLAYLFYYEGIRAVGATRASVFLNIEPVAAMVLGIVILGESLSMPVAFGAALVMAGLILVNGPRRRDAAPYDQTL